LGDGPSSASAAAHLIQEIQTLPEDDLQPRAIAILKVKNRLLADDAKLVEEAFAARMAAQASSRAAPTTDEPASAPINPVLPQPPTSTVSLKRPRGASKKS
jgi:hypothetical protein